MQRVLNSILDGIGHTPVIELKKVLSTTQAKVFAKLENTNPTYSLKDRIAYAMVQNAFDEGGLKKNQTIVTATNGNTGLALAMVCAVKKIKLHIFMPFEATVERKKMFEGFGVKVTLVPKGAGLLKAKEAGEDYVEKNPDTYLLDQFNNQANPLAHSTFTAKEIIDDFPKGVDFFLTGIGTGGSITGIGSALKKKFPKTKIIAVEPDKTPHKIQQIGIGFKPQNLNLKIIDDVIKVSDSEAYHMTKNLAAKEGLLVGISSGANVVAADKLASKLKTDQKILTLMCDAGQRYFSLDKVFH